MPKRLHTTIVVVFFAGIKVTAFEEICAALGPGNALGSLRELRLTGRGLFEWADGTPNLRKPHMELSG